MEDSPLNNYQSNFIYLKEKRVRFIFQYAFLMNMQYKTGIWNPL